MLENANFYWKTVIIVQFSFIIKSLACIRYIVYVLHVQVIFVIINNIETPRAFALEGCIAYVQKNPSG